MTTLSLAEPYDKERMEAISVVESLRAGVPTRASTRTLPDLRAEVTRLIQNDLEGFATGEQPLGRMIWGPYGQGKTHVLTTAEHLALDMGFAVSRVALSREVSCHNLFHFYARVAPATRIPNSSVFGLHRVLSNQQPSTLADTPIVRPDRYVHPLPALVLEDYLHTDSEEQEKLYADLMGQRLPIGDLKRIHREARGEIMPRFESNFSLRDHASAYFGVLADAIKWCGFKGWVLLIDELELIGRLGRVARMKAYRNLNWLLNWNRTMNYPIYVLGAAAMNLQQEIWYAETSRDGGDSVLMPSLARGRNGEQAAREMHSFFERAVGSDSPVVRPVRREDLKTLLVRLADIHGAAYNWRPALDPDRVIDHVGTEPVRTHIRAALEALDLRFIYQEDFVPDASTLVSIPMTFEPGLNDVNDDE